MACADGRCLDLWRNATWRCQETMSGWSHSKGRTFASTTQRSETQHVLTHSTEVGISSRKGKRGSQSLKERNEMRQGPRIWVCHSLQRPPQNSVGFPLKSAKTNGILKKRHTRMIQLRLRHGPASLPGHGLVCRPAMLPFFQDCYSLTKFASEVLYVVCAGLGSPQ